MVKRQGTEETAITNVGTEGGQIQKNGMNASYHPWERGNRLTESIRDAPDAPDVSKANRFMSMSPPCPRMPRPRISAPFGF